MMRSNPFTETGHDIHALKDAIGRKADRNEIHSIHGNVVRLEHTIGELRSTINGLCSRCERLEEIVREINPGVNI